MGILDWLAANQASQITPADRAMMQANQQADAQLGQGASTLASGLNNIVTAPTDIIKNIAGGSTIDLAHPARWAGVDARPPMPSGPNGPGPQGFNAPGVYTPTTDAQGNQPPILSPDQGTQSPGPDLTSAPGGAPPMAPGVMLDDQGNQIGGTSDSGSGPGILQNIMAQAPQAAQDPATSKGFLQRLADGLSDVGDKMKNLSPEASQSLITAGMTMLAANSGGRNLAQIVGEGGIAGMNQYQTMVQNERSAAIEQQKAQQTALQNARQFALESSKLQEVDPSKGAYSYATGYIPPAAGGLPTEYRQKTTDAYGNQYETPYDKFNNQTGPTQQVSAQIPEAQQKRMDAFDQASQDANQQLSRTQNYITQLKNTPVPSGWVGTAQKYLADVTGNPAGGQQLQAQIMRELQQANLQGFKGEGVNRITQGEFKVLNNGLTGNMSSEGLQQWLQAYGHLQEVTANRAAINAAYAHETNGSMHDLIRDTNINGTVYPKGTSINQIVNGSVKGTPIAEYKGSTTQPTATANAPAAPVATPAAVASAASGTINVGGKQYSRADIQAAIDWKRTHPNG